MREGDELFLCERCLDPERRQWEPFMNASVKQRVENTMFDSPPLLYWAACAYSMLALGSRAQEWVSACCTINAELCPEHMKSRSKALRQHVGRRVHWRERVCRAQRLCAECQLFLPPRHKLKTSSHFLVSLRGVVMCAGARVWKGSGPFDLTSLNLIDCDGAVEDT